MIAVIHWAFVMFGIASYYSDPGRMANGQMYDPTQHTCASKTLPFGTRLLLINEENDNESPCVITDRGPFIAGRDIDVSVAVAKDLGMIEAGIARVRIYRVVK